MQIVTYKEAVDYLESFIGKVVFKVDRETLKHKDPLERMRVLLSLLGNPQNKFRSVLVGGTSGKGSTAYLISHILTTGGYKTGLTISPHLQKVNERLQINGKPISDNEFAKMVASMIRIIEVMKSMEIGEPSYFEILIAMAFLYFVEEKVDVAVVEVGMGGEFDATNTLYPLIAVLTNVSLDHTNVLGGTVQKIAKTKVGIIKGSPHPLNNYLSARGSVVLRSLRQFKNFSNASVPAARYSSPRDTVAFGDSSEKFFHAKAPRATFVPEVAGSPRQGLVVVTGVKQPSVIKIVEDRCRGVGAELYRLVKDLPSRPAGGPAGRQGFNFKIKKENLGGSVFDLTTTHDRGLQLNDLNVALLGGYQVENASLAIETVLQLRKFGFKVSEAHIKNALKTAFFPGRFEVVEVNSILRRASLAQDKTSVELVLDGAHNPTKMKAFLSTLKDLFPKERKIFVIGFKFDKDVKKMLRQIAEVAEDIVITQFHAKTDMSKNASLDVSNVKCQMSNVKYNRETRVIIAKNSKMAMDKAFQIAKTQKDSIIVVTGSLYLVGEVRNYLTRPDPDNYSVN